MRPYLKIETPCEASLEKMHNISGGKFCDLCSKKVYDLSSFSHSEILDIIEQNKGGKFCGILINRQPEKTLENSIKRSGNISSKKINITKVAAGFALTAGMINTVPAQTKTISKIEMILSHKNVSEENEESNNYETNNKFITSGRIITSEEEKPVKAHVNLITVNKVYSTETDANGFYSLEIPKELTHEENYLLEFRPFSFDIDQKLKVFNKKELLQNNIIKLADNGIYKELGEISIGPPYASENSVVFLHGKRIDYKLYNKSYSIYSNQYDVHYIPKPFTKFFTESEKVESMYIVFVKTIPENSKK